jgi:hypothetical protein
MPRLKKLNLFSNFSNILFVLPLKTINLLKFTDMKKFAIIIILSAIITQGFSQGLSAESQDDKKQGTTADKDENTNVTGGKDLLKIEDRASTPNLKPGNRGLSILESLEGPEFNFNMYSRNDEKEQEYPVGDHPHKARRFRGHWAGIEFGFNNYTTSLNNFDMPDDIYYMSLHSGKSSNFNLNFSQLSLGFARHIGIVTGLGLNWNNYRFDGKFSIQKADNGQIEPYGTSDIEMSKLTTLFLNLPVMLEVQIPVGHGHHINVAGGGIGALKLHSHTKIVYEDKQKVRNNGDFSLNMLRYGATARVGCENFQIYGTYYLTPLFNTGKGPGGYSLYPFEIGIAFTVNH